MDSLAFSKSNVLTPSFVELKKFISEKQLKSVVFSRRCDTTFHTMFNKVFPHLTSYYEYNVIFYPNYVDMIKFKINQNILNKKLESKELCFYIQTILGNYFSLADISKNADSGLYLYDVVMSDDLNNITLLFDYLVKMTTVKIKTKSLIYFWSDYQRWQLDGRKMYEKKMEDLIGLDEHYKLVKQDLDNYSKNKDLLIKFGVSTGLNYMLYGPPGTGKSSFVRALAMELEIPVFVVKLTSAHGENSITNMLIPNINNTQTFDEEDLTPEEIELKKIRSQFKILLLEDFDRYLTSDNNKAMSSILNALDGIYPAFGVIRFFSANDPSVISKNSALNSRINRHFFFDKPNLDQIKQQINNVYHRKNLDNNLIEKFINFVSGKGLNMRQITNYLCQFLNFENPMEKVVEEMTQWVDNINDFLKYVDKEDNKENVDKNIQKPLPPTYYERHTDDDTDEDTDEDTYEDETIGFL